MECSAMTRCWIFGLVGLSSICLASPPPEPPAAEIAPDEYPLAMKGYCPVTLAAERKWKRGDARFGALHRRRTFLFGSEAEQQKFLLDPDRYTPVLTGYDIVKFVKSGKFVDGSPAHSLTFRKQVYLFLDEGSLEAFMQNPGKFADDAHQAIERKEGRGPIP
jgi:YHS domain-containing protein